MGFSKDGLMVGSSAMVGWFNKKGQPKVLQYYLQGTHPSQVIPNKGELPLSGAPAAVALGGANIYLAFQLKLTKPLLKQPVILAFGTSYPKHHRLTHHDAETTINVHFDSGSFIYTRIWIIFPFCLFCSFTFLFLFSTPCTYLLCICSIFYICALYLICLFTFTTLVSFLAKPIISTQC